MQQPSTASHFAENETGQNTLVFLALIIIIVWAVDTWKNRERYTIVYEEVEDPTANRKDKKSPHKQTRKTPTKPSQSDVRRRLFSSLNKEDKSPKPDYAPETIKVEDLSYKKKRISPYGKVDEPIFDPKPIIEELQVPLRKEQSYTEPSVKSQPTQPMETEDLRPQELYPQQYVQNYQPMRSVVDPVMQEKEDEKKRVELFNAILIGIELVRKRKQLEALASSRNSRGLITIKKKIQESTIKHNTVCLVCFNSCHVQCNLPVIKEKGSSKFKECSAFQKSDNCLGCRHDFSSHAHQRCVWKDVRETFNAGEVTSEHRKTMKQIDTNALFMLEVIYSLTEENVQKCLWIIKEQKYYYRNDQEMQGYLNDVASQLQQAK